jgi:excisionase family DNA binding protein
MIQIDRVKLYTIKEVADFLHVTPQSIRLWIKAGKLKATRIGRPIYIKESDYKEFVNKKLGA